MYEKFIKRTLAISLVFLLLFASIIILFDPFFHYHKPLKGLEPVINDERYQNPGIAEKFSYDSILVGSSMTQNFKVSEINDAFQCDTVKLTYAAIRTGSYKHMFERAFSTRKVKNVFMGLDIDPLIDTYGNYFFPLPEYLYDDNIFNDVNYVFNKSVMCKNTYEYLKYNYKNNVPDIDSAYSWTGDFSKESALKSVYWDYSEVGKEYDTPQYLENAKINLENNILPYIKNNPETDFYVFFPPYNLLWWNLHLNKGDLNGVVDVLTYTSKELLKYDNVKLYFFQDVTELVTDLEQYKDYNHYNEKINSQIVNWFLEDKYRIYENTYEKRITEFKEYVETFDYVKWVEE